MLVEYQEEQYLSDKIEQILNTLNEKEQYIIKHRILSDGSMTRKQIAEQLSVSCERIRQIEERALEKIKIKLMNIK